MEQRGVNSCLLVILQEMWGFISSTPHSLRLLEAALNRGELDLAVELSSFLVKADRAGVLNEKQIRIKEDVSWLGRSEFWSTTAFHVQKTNSGQSRRLEVVDYYLLQAIRNAISKVKVRDMVSIYVKFKLPLAECLRRERHLLSQSFLDVGIVLLKLHLQFEFPEPTLDDVERSVEAAGIASSMEKPSVTAADSLQVHAERPEYGSGLVQHIELQYLESVAEDAAALEILLPVSTILLHVDRVISHLNKSQSAIHLYVQSLERLNSESYRALAAALRSSLLTTAGIPL